MTAFSVVMLGKLALLLLFVFCCSCCCTSESGFSGGAFNFFLFFRLT